AGSNNTLEHRVRAPASPAQSCLWSEGEAASSTPSGERGASEGGQRHPPSELPHVPGVPERVPPRLRPYGEAVRLAADRDRLDLARGRVDHVDDVVVAAGEPQGLAVHADVAH